MLRSFCVAGWDTITISNSDETPADTTLLLGLSEAMSAQEASYVTLLLTSGVEDDVIKGAGILSGVEAMVRVGEVQDGVERKVRCLASIR